MKLQKLYALYFIRVILQSHSNKNKTRKMKITHIFYDIDKDIYYVKLCYYKNYKIEKQEQKVTSAYLNPYSKYRMDN